MSETAKEAATRSSGVTTEMVDAAEKVLPELYIRNLSKKFPNRDVLYEILRAALKDTVVPQARKMVPGQTLVMDEDEWKEFLETCMVVVRDPVVGQELLKVGTGSAEAFAAIVDTISQNRGLIVPLTKYPGVKLFSSRRGKKESPEQEADSEKDER